MDIDKKIEEAVQRAMKDAAQNKAPAMPSEILKDGLMKDLYDDMLDFRKRSSNSMPTKEIRDAYIQRQAERMNKLRACTTLTASERIMFQMAERALLKIAHMPVKR